LDFACVVNLFIEPVNKKLDKLFQKLAVLQYLGEEKKPSDQQTKRESIKTQSPCYFIPLLYYSVRKVSDFFFFENLVNFSEAHLHETTLNLHMHA
jgi:hypothetical protein